MSKPSPPPNATTCAAVKEGSEDKTSLPPAKKRGRKKGCKVDLMSLLAGGIGGRPEKARVSAQSKWKFDKKEEEISHNDDSSFSSYYTDSDDELFLTRRRLIVYPI